jgi:hypothetical protein
MALLPKFYITGTDRNPLVVITLATYVASSVARVEKLIGGFTTMRDRTQEGYTTYRRDTNEPIAVVLKVYEPVALDDANGSSLPVAPVR